MPENSSGRTVGSLTEEQQRKALGILAADRLMGMGGAMRSRLMAERLARKTQDGTIGQSTEMYEDELLKDMNINVGDTYHVQQEQTPAPQNGNKRKVWPYLLAAALLGSGIGAGTYALVNLLNTPPTIDTDTDTHYELRITSGDE